MEVLSLSTKLLLFITLFTNINALGYNVQWLSGPALIERDILKQPKEKVEIYCFVGSSKSILALWQTAKFHIKTRNNEFRQYLGSNPEEVYNEYTEESYGWTVVNPFIKKTYKSVTLDLFNTTCMAINTKEKYSIELQIIRVDIWRVILMFIGIGVIMLSRTLSGNPVFFYLCGMFIGVSASFMVLVYYISKLLPKKTLTYGILIGGWTVGIYVFQQIWENTRSIVASYQTYVFWYTILIGFISFLVCYRIGPPKNERSKNLVKWTLQGVGVLMIFFSSEYQEAAAGVILITLMLKYFPRSILLSIGSYWRRKFPPKLRLLTNEEYYEQGARETKQALDNLRKHCSSPDCAQWKIMLKLNDSKRFASFVEGDSHLTDDEILNYETYTFSMNDDSSRRTPRRRRRTVHDTTTRNEAPTRRIHSVSNCITADLEISEDDSSDDSEIVCS